MSRVVTAADVAAARPGTALPVWVWFGVPLAAALALYAPLLPDLAREWLEFPTLSHGFAIPAIAAYLVWTRRDRLRAVAAVPSGWGVPVLVAGLLALVAGVHGQEPFVARMSIPVTLLGLTLTLAGPRVTREAWMGIAYLAFMVPLPYATLKLLTQRSRFFDAALSGELLQWLGVPVLRDGVMLYLPNVTLEVADDCSSVTGIVALLSLGVLYACVSRSPLPVRVALVLSTLPLAVGANILRITGTAAAAYYVGTWTLGAFYHQFSGTVNFLLTFGLLLLVEQWLGRWAAGRRR